MPRYFFDVIDPQGTSRDDIGTECANYAEMRAMTLRTICEIAAETRWRSETPEYGITVRDASNQEVYAVDLNLIERNRLVA